MKKVLWIILVLLAQYSINAQNLPNIYNQFFMNPYVYNPAYAGVEGHSVLFASYKKQWTGINGAPTLSNVNFHVPLKGGLAFGAYAYNFSYGPISTSAGKVSGGYLISIDREHFFRFGMSLGAGSSMLKTGELDAPNDPAIQRFAGSQAFNQTFLIGDVGVAYHFGHFNVGVALPYLFQHQAFSTQPGLSDFMFKPQDNALFQMNYRGHLNDNIAIEPHILYRYHKYLANQFEAAVILHLLHIVWVGGSYRQGYGGGFNGLIGAKFWERMAVGYAYQYGNLNTNSQTGPTHEITIGYHISSRKEHVQHVSSFIKSHRKSAEERAKEAELERQRKLQALQRSRQTNKEDEDALSLVASAPKKEEPKKEIPHNWNYEKENDPVTRINQFGEEERGIKFDRINEKGEKEVVFSWLPPPPEGAQEETYEIANPDEEPLIRTRPDGIKEAGIKWVRTIDGGEKETLIIWDEIMSAEKADQLDHNKSEAVSMQNAKISIKREQPIIKEEPVKEAPKEEISHNWNYEKENEPVTRINEYGEEERGIKFDRINENGEKEVVFSWLPPPPEGTQEETYEIADTSSELLIRTKPDGTREAGITWIRTLDNGQKETLVIWNEILSEEEASKLDHNKSEAMSLQNAKISIRRKEPEIVKEQPKEEVAKGDPTLTDDFRRPEEYASSGERQVAKKGTSIIELAAGNYVVAGVFENFQGAEDLSDQLFQRGFHDAKVGFLSARGYYYVVIYESGNLSMVTREKNRVKSLSGLSKVWVLTVEE